LIEQYKGFGIGYLYDNGYFDLDEYYYPPELKIIRKMKKHNPGFRFIHKLYADNQPRKSKDN